MPAANESRSLELRRAIDRLLDGVALAGLRQASERLSAVYRDRVPGAAPMMTAHDRLAYVAARLPATFEATRVVLRDLRRRAPDLEVESLLELGAGPAPGLWAAGPYFARLSRATHVEIDAGMAELGRRLLEAGRITESVASTWRVRDLARAGDFGAHDLVLVCYVLGELAEPARDELIETAWDAAASGLVIVEPGTPSGAARVLRARARLLERGATVAAPCPHGAVCPLPSDDWCHFGARVSRSSVQRQLKRGSLAYEDENYSYVAVVRGNAEQCAARVLRRPVSEPRRVSLRLCARDGLRRELVTRREGERYRAARKVRWGDGWQPPGGETGERM